jgi:methylated-DNA-[protein]-cysteine S-methyltransferase
MKEAWFNEQCYELLKKVPKGRVTTYKEIANALGNKAYRAVGNAMNRNKDSPLIPCHRCVNSNGEVGGYVFGIKNKISMLTKEGIEIKKGKIMNFDKVLFSFE